MIWHIYIWVAVILLALVICPGLEQMTERWPASKAWRRAFVTAYICFYLNIVACMISVYALVAKLFLTLTGF